MGLLYMHTTPAAKQQTLHTCCVKISRLNPFALAQRALLATGQHVLYKQAVHKARPHLRLWLQVPVQTAKGAWVFHA